MLLLVCTSKCPEAKPWKAKYGAFEYLFRREVLSKSVGWSFLNEGVIVARVLAIDAVKTVGCIANCAGETAYSVLVVGYRNDPDGISCVTLPIIENLTQLETSDRLWVLFPQEHFSRPD